MRHLVACFALLLLRAHVPRHHLIRLEVGRCEGTVRRVERRTRAAVGQHVLCVVD